MGISFDNIVDILHNKNLIKDDNYNTIKMIKGDSDKQRELTLNAINKNWKQWYDENKGEYPDVNAFFKGTKMTPTSGCGFIDSQNKRCIGIKNRIKELYTKETQNPQEGGKKRGKKTKKSVKKGKKKTMKKKGKKKTKKSVKKGKKKTMKKKGKKKSRK